MTHGLDAGLGLRYGVVELAPHRPQWAAAFADERERLRRALVPVACEIEHIGSTAVPGLLAKPILDVGVGLAPGLGPELLIPMLEGASYQYRGDAASQGGHVFVRESSPRVRTHHLHLVSQDDPQWQQYLRFRDLLRRSADARETYQREKRALAERHPRDRAAYTVAKDDVVSRLLEVAPSL